MIVITVTKDSVATRLVLGCETPAEAIQRRLRARGYKIKVADAEPPERDQAERHRATKLMAELFAH